jgi:hypothetical protein
MSEKQIVKLHKTASTAQFPDDFQSPFHKPIYCQSGRVKLMYNGMKSSIMKTSQSGMIFFWYSYFLLMLLLKVYNKLTFQSKFSPCIVEINFWLKKP